MEHYDVVIVGGAAMGSAAAYFLASAPAFDGRLLVLEQDFSYQRCATTLSVASVRHQFSTPENIRMSMFGTDFIRQAPTLLMVDGEAPDLAWREGGYLFLASAAGLDTLHANHRTQRELGRRHRREVDAEPGEELRLVLCRGDVERRGVEHLRDQQPLLRHRMGIELPLQLLVDDPFVRGVHVDDHQAALVLRQHIDAGELRDRQAKRQVAGRRCRRRAGGRALGQHGQVLGNRLLDAQCLLPGKRRPGGTRRRFARCWCRCRPST